ncbi:uncharacterized protein LOC131619968 [Vicia villosa]|uniref:uncharacterized protein LOC131619968 n=1 Tax=Vicia villosa TaxID=3911 RepID=UPI00273B43D3|nr:uncharacterized protein LOC131619968 [Vicia villosa]
MKERIKELGLSLVLPDVIDEEQSAFVQGRLIMDNALIAMECFHWMKKKIKGKRGVMTLKLDMSKAGLLNGQLRCNITPGRGLRQGDHLSPYLFILCVDVRSGLLKKEACDLKIHGTRIARQAPTISHLLFAGDNLLFTRATPQEDDNIMAILHKYQVSSGQVVNLDKSEVSFTRNVCEESMELLRARIGVRFVITHSKYLGLQKDGYGKPIMTLFIAIHVWLLALSFPCPTAISGIA